MIKVCFRVDGSSNIGMGHVMRCLSLADEFKNAGCGVSFISKYNEGINKIEQLEFNVIKLSNNDKEKNVEGFYYGSENQLENEAEEIIGYLKNYKFDLLIIDSYNVTEKFFLKLRSFVKKIGYIDDLNKFIYPVDILINCNIIADDMGYQKYSDNEIMFLGTKYNLLRKEFVNLPKRQINKQAKEIMITTGGSDPFNISTKIVNILLSENNVKDLKINIVIGSGFKDIEKLKEISRLNQNVILHENVKHMSKIMLRCDIAISSGGSTLYELCACGTPTLAFIVADNQVNLVSKMDNLHYIKSLGWYNDFSDQELLSFIKQLNTDYGVRKEQSLRMQRLLDGKGTYRIVKKIVNSFNDYS